MTDEQIFMSECVCAFASFLSKSEISIMKLE
jgi:hypothetical protein